MSKYTILLILSLIISVLGGLIAKSWLVGLIGAILSVTINLAFKPKTTTNNTRSETPVETNVPKEPVIDEVDISEQLENLIRLNLMVRNDPYLNSEMVEKMESIIDRLTKILPEVNEKFPTNKCALIINETARTYLIDQYNTYLELGPDQREKYHETLMETLEAISKDINQVNGIILRGQVSDFKSEIKFLEKRYPTN